MKHDSVKRKLALLRFIVKLKFYDNDIGYEMSALIIVLPKKSVRKFSDEFSKYVFNRTSFQSPFFTEDQFSLNRANRTALSSCAQKNVWRVTRKLPSLESFNNPNVIELKKGGVVFKTEVETALSMLIVCAKAHYK